MNPEDRIEQVDFDRLEAVESMHNQLFEGHGDHDPATCDGCYLMRTIRFLCQLIDSDWQETRAVARRAAYERCAIMLLSNTDVTRQQLAEQLRSIALHEDGADE